MKIINNILFKNCLIIFLLLGNSLIAQTSIQGIVKDSINNPISYANILIKPINSDIVTAYTHSETDGSYKLNINEIGLFEITYAAISYKSEIKTISFEDGKNIIKNITLKDETIELNEVIIEKENAIIIKQDTIVFNAKDFSQGNEQVVEDLLKKIPGISISNDGVIKIGGQEVEKVMIEGDDFFEKGYKLLTKNMPANPIEKVELYQHYSNNKHLKGVENSDKVALNLKLKDDAKREWFGNLQLGYGLVSENRYDVRTNLMNFGKKIKYYFLSNLNNVGADAVGDIDHLIRAC
ncbi:carboxypeptidase-like regulatory domain-containing protein [Flavobacterium muglaense]|uniref:Carboxypeptidase-like regulatory domain-containing protein n=1 Tax=Flavobacterium muglaense TaxID=2764716 RepID=A0A923N5B7_9FLAO|nr:carboxypeptidase-like regulatory domain-containing protein [Flavobacterium muglaense]MBC5839763.1 carboxypeptidase-like regulatory domain-containing protein [Flavobacterium muglaense]MBC5846290.1 carboxypeptidase-like regulatory domain-containing protein [Flavobacterium muglaense]